MSTSVNGHNPAPPLKGGPPTWLMQLAGTIARERPAAAILVGIAVVLFALATLFPEGDPIREAVADYIHNKGGSSGKLRDAGAAPNTPPSATADGGSHGD